MEISINDRNTNEALPMIININKNAREKRVFTRSQPLSTGIRKDSMNKHNNSVSYFQTSDPDVYNVRLRLFGKPKLIGVLDTKGEGVFLAVRSSKKKHKFNNGNQVGINYELLTDATINFMFIVIILDGRELVTTRNYFLHKGKAMQFTKQGFELQVFMPISEFNIEAALAYEDELKKKHNPIKPEATLFDSHSGEVVN